MIIFPDDLLADEYFLAGERAYPGRYREVSSGREVVIEADGCLPAGRNGKAAAYVCISYVWQLRDAEVWTHKFRGRDD